MLPTFVIGLREGLEAALIVGIIAAFLRRQGRGDLMRQLALGVAAAVGICALVGVGLELWSRALPQRQQEGLETVIAVLAVGMVTYMVLWMKEHSRGLRGELESLAAGAIDGRGRAGLALLAMAFLAVLREGFETAVFLLAAFNEAGSGAGAAVGAILGLAVAVALGYGIYRGGVRLNLSKFFRATGLVLVLVAGGLVVSALHTAHEAGWLDAGQQPLLDLTWLVRPGSVLSSVLTGMLGLQPTPVLAEVSGWLLYVVPLGVFVAWPPGRPVPWRRFRVGAAAVAVVGLAGGAVLTVTAPEQPEARPVLTDGTVTAQVVDGGGNTLLLRTTAQRPLAGTSTGVVEVPVHHVGSRRTDGVTVATYRGTLSGPASGPATLPAVRVAELNGGRLPLGLVGDPLPARYTEQRTLDVAVEPRTGRVVALDWTAVRRATVTGADGRDVTLPGALDRARSSLSRAAAGAAVHAAHEDLAAHADHADRLAWARLCLLLGGAAALGAVVPALRRESRGSLGAVEAH